MAGSNLLFIATPHKLLSTNGYSLRGERPQFGFKVLSLEHAWHSRFARMRGPVVLTLFLEFWRCLSTWLPSCAAETRWLTKSDACY